MTGRTKARLISLRMWVRRRDKRVVRLVIFALFIFVTVGLYRGFRFAGGISGYQIDKYG